MTLRTPDKPIDIVRTFPFLAGRQRTTTRLHPRRGEPTRSDSSMGGDLLWPLAEPWPRCPGHDILAAPVLQLRRADVPGLPWRGDEDLFQLLWCAGAHDDLCPPITVVWRDSTAMTEPLDESPLTEAYMLDLWDRDVTVDELLPMPCRVSPEDVVEFPAWWELSDDERNAIKAWRGQDEIYYAYHLGAAPGTKVGGWPGWIQDPEWPDCAAGHPMDYLLSIASWEFDGESWKTWLPRTDLVAGEPPSNRDFAADIMIGDAGDVYVFTCLTCLDRPIRAIAQCS